MLLAELIFTGSLGWTALLAGVVVIGGLVFWAYRATVTGWVRWTCLGGKVLGFTLLLFCLLEPLWAGRRARPGANVFAVVADNSESLQVRDGGRTVTRSEELQSLLAPTPGGWQAGLEEAFELRRYLFDTRVRAVRDFQEMTSAGRGTVLHGALADLAERYEGRPLAGVILLTDGNATDAAERLDEAGPLPPVYPVVIGEPGAVRDLAVSQVHVSQTVFEDAPVSVRVEARTVGLPGSALEVELVGRSGEVVERQTGRVRQEDGVQTFQFDRLEGAPTGVSFYEARVKLKDSSSEEPTALGLGEATGVNNRRGIVVDRGQGPHRVLYVAGRPNWEYKFLNRALQEDDQMQLAALMRVARREPKFEFRGRGGESSNPLYRGFGDQAPEEVERYDQPVFVRLNTEDELELRGGFPGTPEELFRYEAVILDDVEAAFFTADQAELLRRFVSERGGGLLMLGGAESFREGGYAQTPIGDLLPVYLERGSAAAPANGVHYELSREGWLQTWARLRRDEVTERERLESMPAFQVFNYAGATKPGASLVGVVRDSGGHEVPALVTQRFGRGRTAALMVGDLWRWGMQDPESREDMNKAWRQWVRWLVADVPRRAEIAAVPADGAPGAVRLQVRVRDEAFEPMDDASVALEVRPVVLGPEEGTTDAGIRLRAEPSLEEAGVYETVFVPRSSGAYEVTAGVTNAAGVGIHQVQGGWVADPAGEELRSLEPNLALLEALARRTGGRVIRAGDLGRLVQELPRRTAPVMEAWSYPLWHTPWLFGLALLCLVAEWGLRRWKGLP